MHYEEKKSAMESILGPLGDLVGHAIIPFEIGGAVDMYYFHEAMDGTAFATMELIEPDGSGPKPGRIGTFELVAFTRQEFTAERDGPFSSIERRFCGIFTTLGNYASQAVLNPRETCEVPAGEDEDNRCLVFDEWKKPGVEFEIRGKKHGLLLCIEVFRNEMEYAMENGTLRLLQKLKKSGHYPYSDLEREPVV